MWILAKLTLSIAVFIYRFARGGTSEPPELDKKTGGVPYSVYLRKHKGNVRDTTFTFKLKSASLFGFSRERWYDRLAKSLGIASEIQTGAKDFDQKVYVLSDSFTLAEKLKLNHEVCKSISSLFEKEKLERIVCDSEALEFIFDGDVESDGHLIEKSAEIAVSFTQMGLERRKPFDERFFIRALVVETMIWSIASYAACGFLEIFAWKTDTMKDWTDVFGYGAVFGMILFAVPLAFTVLFMRGSSRGHRIVLEASLLLFLFSGAAGMEAACDINKAFDKSQPVVFDLKIQSKHHTITHGRRGRQHHHYKIRFAHQDSKGGIEPPDQMEVSSGYFNEAVEGGNARVTMKKGALGAPWYTSLDFLGGNGGF